MRPPSCQACHRCDNSLCLFFAVGFSECLFALRLRECVQQEARVSQAVVSLWHLEGKSGGEVQSLPVAKCPPGLTSTPMGISFNDTKLNLSDRQALTQRAVKCERCATFARMSRSCGSRQTENVDLCDWVDVRGNRYGWLVAVDRHSWSHHVPATRVQGSPRMADGTILQHQVAGVSATRLFTR